jgi:hypothetical protein
MKMIGAIGELARGAISHEIHRFGLIADCLVQAEVQSSGAQDINQGS